MTDAPIEIVDYDPRWAEQFLRERDILCAALADWLVAMPEHIGSTAVPGLPAKPVIDIMAPVQSLQAAVPAIEAAKRVGYVHFPYKPDVMHWFCKPSPEARTHHLHLVPLGSDLWNERLVFRDALRADPALRSRYAELKRAWAAQYRHDREAYTEAKTPFIAGVLRERATNRQAHDRRPT